MSGKLLPDYFASLDQQTTYAAKLVQLLVARTDKAQLCLQKNGNNLTKAFNDVQTLKNAGKIPLEYFQVKGTTKTPWSDTVVIVIAVVSAEGAKCNNRSGTVVALRACTMLNLNLKREEQRSA